MAVVPVDFDQRVDEAVAALNAATRDPNNAANMKTASAKYARAKRVLAIMPVGGDLDPDLERIAAGKRRLEAAADALRQSLRNHGLDASRW